MSVYLPRQARSQETLDRIVEAALEIFGEHGTTAVPIQAICRRSGASKSSFYARFSSREALVRVAFDRFASRTLEVVGNVDARWAKERRGGHDLRDLVYRILNEFSRYFDGRLDLVQAFCFAERKDPELVERRRGLDQEILRRCMDCVIRHYPELDRQEVSDHLAPGMAVIAAATTGALCLSNRLSLAVPDGREGLVGQVTDLIMAFLPVTESSPSGWRVIPVGSPGRE